MIKMLVPHRHAGALIGKGGENMKVLENMSQARVKLSQSSEFYPETGERVLSARGDAQQVQRAIEMVLQSLDQSSRRNLEEGAEVPSQQVRLIIPERAAGSLIGKGGENIRKLQEETNCRISVSGKVCRRRDLRAVGIQGDETSGRERGMQSSPIHRLN